MKKILLLLLVFAGFIACENEVIAPEITEIEADQEISISARTGGVSICHKNAGEIVIGEAAVETHIAHGDAVDRDGDGFYNIENPCSEIDCDDENVEVNPNAEEICDDIDNDCNGEIDEGIQAPPNPLNEGVCAGTTQICINGQWYEDYGPYYQEVETECDGLDNDCDGVVDEGCTGIFFNCSNPDYTSSPYYQEVETECDGLDNDCDGVVDEGCDPLQIGDFYQGGAVFYILQPHDDGYIEGEIHGLIASLETTPNQEELSWYNGTYLFVDWTFKKIGVGRENTLNIINAQGQGNYAAFICNELIENGYNDWYLPSSDELVQMAIQMDAIDLVIDAQGGTFMFPTEFYWSSTEIHSDFAIAVEMETGFVDDEANKINEYFVRAVRAF